MTQPALATLGTLQQPLMIALTGASGSGKTTLCRELARALDGLHFPLDHYYRDLSHLPPEQRAETNFDDPAMLEAELLTRHLSVLARGQAIERPIYDFATHSRALGQTETIQPRGVILAEGLFAWSHASVRPLFHFSVYVDAPDSLCFDRRLRRDVEERGRTPDSVRQQYDSTVRPCGLAFVRPLAELMDLTIDGSDALDFKVEAVIAALRRRRLLQSEALQRKEQQHRSVIPLMGTDPKAFSGKV